MAIKCEQTDTLSREMSESIASLENLQALRLVLMESDIGSETLEPISKIKNLKHLHLQNLGYYDLDQKNLFRTMLLNSSTTLQSLLIWSNAYSNTFMSGFADIFAKDEIISQRKYAFPALKSLGLHGPSFNAQLISPTQKTLDFMALRDLSIEGQGLTLALSNLANEARLATEKGTTISLQSLTLDMNLNEYRARREHIRDTICASASFLSAFDTLTSLEIKSYQHHKNTSIDPLSTISLLQAITKHTNLRTLKFSHAGIISENRIAFFGASSVTAIMESCPHLKEFEFAPQEAEIVSFSLLLRHVSVIWLKMIPTTHTLYRKPLDKSSATATTSSHSNFSHMIATSAIPGQKMPVSKSWNPSSTLTYLVIWSKTQNLSHGNPISSLDISL